MALLQISEPGMSPEPHKRKIAVGIDLGTTNSLVASMRHANPAVLLGHDGSAIVPSVVRYRADGIDIGVEAVAQQSIDAENTIVSVKRLMGRTAGDVLKIGNQAGVSFVERDDNVPGIQTVAGVKTPVEVSADILRVLRLRAEESMDGPVDGAVITVPAYFDDAQRQATKDAASLAGLKTLRLLNEPTAAAVAYGLDQKNDTTIAVYDLGGGTFDISVLHLSKGVFEVLSTGGDSALGGDDFDLAIASWAKEQLGIGDLDAGQYRELMRLARAAKEALSDSQETELSIAFADVSINLSRQKFAELVEPLVRRSLDACRLALRDADCSVDDIDEVVMVGGSTRTLYVREQVSALFGKPVLTDIDPDQVVALGAAIQADILVGNKPDSDLLLLDVIPLSLGLETMGGLVEKVIHRNTTIPVGMAQEFTTYKDGQTAMVVHVLQGERDLVENCRSLARFELRGIPPMAAGAAKIRVTFQVDADGLLSVAAKETESGVQASVQVKPSYGLGDEEITNMLKSSYDHAADDKDARALREQQVDADRLLESLIGAMHDDGDALLSDTESQQIVAEMEALAKARNELDAIALKQKIEAVSQATDFFAARRMDAAIKRALAGHTLEEIDPDQK